MDKPEQIGILLSAGLTKKEIASTLWRSQHTVNQQARIVYLRTNSHNLADITRYTIGKLLNANMDKMLYIIARKLIMETLIQDGMRPDTCIRILNRKFYKTI